MEEKHYLCIFSQTHRIMSISCPSCEGTNVIKNGLTRHKKQNHKCKDCGRQFTLNPKQKLISTLVREQIQRALLERLSYRAICRVFDVSLSWLLWYASTLSEYADEHLSFEAPEGLNKDDLVFELDELWTYSGKKEEPQWVWIVLERKTRQVVCFHVGDRSKESAKKVWDKLQAQGVLGLYYTDMLASYGCALPEDKHTANKTKKETNHIERLNGTLRARASRLVRKTYSFSKSVDALIGHLTYFFNAYNKEQIAKIPLPI